MDIRTMKRDSRRRIVRYSLLAASAVAIAGISLGGWRHPSSAGLSEKPAASAVKPVAAGDHPSKIAGGGAADPGELSRRAALFPTFQKHPFAVVRESENYGWTAEDGKSPAVICDLAHNELEFERMAEESSRILGRQLVYAKQTCDILVQQSKLSGEPIHQLTLPGLSGQQFEFEITQADLNPSGQQGTFTGRLAGQPDSTVTLAYKGGREAFTILSPSDGTYLVGEPRESGELIVKSIDPATYVAGVCGNP